MSKNIGAVLALLTGMTVAMPVHAKIPLRDVAEIDNHLMSIAIADEIRKECDDISARMIKALSVLQGLKSRARALGYSNDEIDDYVTSEAEKNRMRKKAEAWLSARGVDGYDRSQLCAFGRDQIRAGGQIGELLR